MRCPPVHDLAALIVDGGVAASTRAHRGRGATTTIATDPDGGDEIRAWLNGR